MPDGKVVRFPNEMPREQIKAIILRKYPHVASGSPLQRVTGAGAEPQVDTAYDVAASALAGVPRGVGDVAGLPADLFSLTVRGLDAGKNLITGRNDQTPLPDWLPTSEAIKNTASKVTGISLYEPKTWQGKIAGKVGEFATGAAALGPTHEIGAMGLNALKYGVVPGILSEGGGQLSEAMGEPQGVSDAVRVVGAIGGGGLAKLKPTLRAPTNEALGDTAKALYQASKNEGIAIAPNAMVRLANDVEKALAAGGGTGVAAGKINPMTTAALEEVQNVATSGKAVTLEDLERLRRVVKNAGKAVEGSDPALSASMRQAMDEFLANLQPSDLAVPGAPQKAVSLLNAARLNWTRMSKGETLDEVMRNAELSPAWRNGDRSSAITAAFRTLAKNPREMRYFSPTERKAIEAAVKSNRGEAVLRWLARFSPVSHPWSAAFGSGVAGYGGGPLAAAAVPVGAEAARAAANAMAMRDANIAGSLVRGGTVDRGPSMIPMGLFYNQIAPDRRAALARELSRGR